VLELPHPFGGVKPVKPAGNSDEVEIKIAIPSAADATGMLLSKGFAVVAPRVLESNDVLDTPLGALRTQGCLLRIRSAAECVLTFKGPATQGRHKSREEFETRISDAISAGRLFQRLGYEVSFRYEKYRTEFARADDPGVVTVDETPIGDFMEIEGPAQWIDATAGELGFTVDQYLTASYGSLYRQHCAAKGITPTNMIFGEEPSRQSG
jgi:adenylate cyclase class 2